MDVSRKNISLPAAVLTGFVFPFVGVKTLKKCAVVCKEWNTAVDQDVIWKAQCVALWRNKKNVPRVILNQQGEPEPESLYPYAIYGPHVKLSMKELKQILQARDIHVEKFIEKCEFQRALELSQPRSTAGWGALYSSKWKTSYVYSVVRAAEERITRHELITTYWKVEFKFNGMTSEAKFLGDGTYWSTLGQLNGREVMRWVLVPNADGNAFDYTATRVEEYPPLVVRRTEDWGFELHNDYVVFRQVKPPK